MLLCSILFGILFDQVAKAAYQKNKDPLDAAIFYLAMKKKNVLWGLFRSSNDDKMTAFFKNNFNEDRFVLSLSTSSFTISDFRFSMHLKTWF